VASLFPRFASISEALADLTGLQSEAILAA
jgi:hypothetical protein